MLPHWKAPGEIMCMWGWKLVFVPEQGSTCRRREERRSHSGGFRVTESSAPSLPLCTQCPPEPPSRHPLSHPATSQQVTSSFTELVFPVMGDICVVRHSQKQEPISSGRVLKGGPLWAAEGSLSPRNPPVFQEWVLRAPLSKLKLW